MDPANRSRSSATRLRRSEYDRNFTEPGGVAHALPGVQVLFAFLLTVPFAQGFTSLTRFERDLYLVVLLETALASALLIAPTAYHRVLSRTDTGHRSCPSRTARRLRASASSPWR